LHSLEAEHGFPILVLYMLEGNLFLKDLKFWQWCRWRFKSSGRLQHVRG